MRPTLSILLAIYLFAGCGNFSEQSGTKSMEAEEAQFAMASRADQSRSEPMVRKLIRNAEYRIQVESVDASTNRIRLQAQAMGGYISSQSQTTSNQRLSNHIVVRVPAKQLDSLMAFTSKEALFTHYRRVHSDDVTEEFVDLTIRLDTKKEVRDRYIDILRNQAKTVEDILAAEEKIRVLQEEIEAAEGRLRYLNNQVEMSTLTVDMYEKTTLALAPEQLEKPFFGRAWRNIRNGWTLVVDFVLGLLYLWPFLLVGGLIWWQRKRIFRWRKKAKA